MMILKKFAAAIAVVASVAAFAGSAQAQVSSEKVVKPFTIKLGGSYFTDAKKAGYSVGALYEIGKTKDTSPFVYGLFVDYNTPYNKISGKRVSVVSGGVQARYLLAPANGPSGTPYIGGGIGAYHFDGAGTKKTKFGGKVLAGYELKNGFLGEISYNITGEKKASFLDYRIGYRF